MLTSEMLHSVQHDSAVSLRCFTEHALSYRRVQHDSAVSLRCFTEHALSYRRVQRDNALSINTLSGSRPKSAQFAPQIR